MYYSAITVTTKPGIRFQGIEHLKKFSSWIEEKYSIPTQVLGNMSGPIYENHVVSRYESAAHMEEVYAKLMDDPEYMEWFKEGADLLGWSDARQTVYQVF
ncbi:MAG: hypothetical protein JSV42_16835 [Chloroflexota bacterium]|nr:MAG: hypothetical protein JSV42_16835 [Chloroflexota bacterium]